MKRHKKTINRKEFAKVLADFREFAMLTGNVDGLLLLKPYPCEGSNYVVVVSSHQQPELKILQNKKENFANAE